MSNKKRGLSVVYSFQSPKFIFANVTFTKSQTQKKMLKPHIIPRNTKNPMSTLSLQTICLIKDDKNLNHQFLSIYINASSTHINRHNKLKHIKPNNISGSNCKYHWLSKIIHHKNKLILSYRWVHLEEIFTNFEQLHNLNHLKVFPTVTPTSCSSTFLSAAA